MTFVLGHCGSLTKGLIIGNVFCADLFNASFCCSDVSDGIKLIFDILRVGLGEQWIDIKGDAADTEKMKNRWISFVQVFYNIFSFSNNSHLLQLPLSLLTASLGGFCSPSATPSFTGS